MHASRAAEAAKYRSYAAMLQRSGLRGRKALVQFRQGCHRVARVVFQTWRMAFVIRYLVSINHLQVVYCNNVYKPNRINALACRMPHATKPAPPLSPLS